MMEGGRGEAVGNSASEYGCGFRGRGLPAAVCVSGTSEASEVPSFAAAAGVAMSPHPEGECREGKSGA